MQLFEEGIESIFSTVHTYMYKLWSRG